MKPVLLLVDLQNDFLAARELQPPAEALINRVAALLDRCRARRIPVIHIWTTVRREDDRRLPHWREAGRWWCVAGTAGHETPLKPFEDETLVHKTGFNPFATGELEKALEKLDRDSVLIAGLHLHACVRTTATECLERGLQVQIAEDAVASNDPVHAAATRRWLAERCVVFEPVNTILARLDDRMPSRVHRSPRFSDQVLFEMPLSTPSQITTATMAAQKAWEDWRRSSLPDRLGVFERFAGRLRSGASDLARQMATEIGKPFSHGLEETHRAADNIRDVIRRAAQPALRQESAGKVRHQPLGVIGVISPWNNPVAIPAGKLAPALVYGNTVVWKPAPAATRLSGVMLQMLYDAGLPCDVVRLLTGDHTTAQRLAADENVNAVTFTGSWLGGHALQEICARRFVPLQAELSGNNAAIVWDDADLTQAAAQIAWGAFGFAGQRCTANRRVIVPEPCFESLMKALKSAGEQLVWGDPLEPETQVGPVLSTGKRDEIAGTLAASRSRVHRVELLQEARGRESWVTAGAYVPSAIVGCDQPDAPIVQEETMGPILVVQRAMDFDHALDLCNGVRHGLIASLFSQSRELQRKFLAEARAGILKFNSSTAGVDVSLPFGGWKASGIGPPEHGEGDPLFYTQMQAVYGAEGLLEISQSTG